MLRVLEARRYRGAGLKRKFSFGIAGRESPSLSASLNKPKSKLKAAESSSENEGGEKLRSWVHSGPLHFLRGCSALPCAEDREHHRGGLSFCY